MRKFFVKNYSDQPLTVGIEPWAVSEVLPPLGEVTFEYKEYEEPAELAFGVYNEGSVSVEVWGDVVKIAGPSGEQVFKDPRTNKE